MIDLYEDEIITTPTHPFYVPQKGWTSATKLRAGDILVLLNGEYAILEQVQHELLEKPIQVYNFQVEDYHTYYVGDTGVLVHNSCSQKHHVMTNKNKQFTPTFFEIAQKYNLKLSQNWNIRVITNHLGRHSTAYHEFVLQRIMSIDVVAAGNQGKFLVFFEKLADYIVTHPGIMY